MKTLFILLISFTISIQINAQIPAAITIEPATATAYDSMTLIFNPELSCYQSGSLIGLDSIAIHSGVTYFNGPQWMNVIDFNGTGMNNQATTLYPTGDGRFAITFVPYEYYGFPEGTMITEICAVFNNGINWEDDGKDYIDQTSYCMDFFIPIAISSDCPFQDVTFESQSQVDNFQIHYPFCSVMEYNIAIDGSDINNLNGLSGINTIYGDLEIGRLQGFGNSYLKNLMGLEELSFIGGGLEIIENDSLQSLTGLDNLNHIGPLGLFIYNNSELRMCETNAICNFIANTPELVYIENNAVGCNSEEEVEDSCNIVSASSDDFQKFRAIPNPFQSDILLEYHLREAAHVYFMIYNSMGKLVYERHIKQDPGFQAIHWDASGFSDGIYLYQLFINGNPKDGNIIIKNNKR